MATVRLTLGQVTGLNHGRVKLPESMKQAISGYTVSQRPDYNNKSNIHIKNSGSAVKTGILSEQKNKDVYTDDGTLYDIRREFGTIAKGKTESSIKKINQLSIPGTPAMIDKLTLLFFDTIIQCPNLCAEYLEVLRAFEPVNFTKDALYESFCRLVISRYLHPVKLEATKLETAEDRTKKHTAALCLLIATLFTMDHHNQVFIRFFGVQEAVNRFIEPLFQRMEQGDVQAVHNVATVWPMLLAKWDLSKYTDRLTAIYMNSKLFKLSVRLLLKMD